MVLVRCLYGACTVHTRCMYSVCTMYIQCMYGAVSVLCTVQIICCAPLFNYTVTSPQKYILVDLNLCTELLPLFPTSQTDVISNTIMEDFIKTGFNPRFVNDSQFTSQDLECTRPNGWLNQQIFLSICCGY